MSVLGLLDGNGPNIVLYLFGSSVVITGDGTAGIADDDCGVYRAEALLS